MKPRRPRKPRSDRLTIGQLQSLRAHARRVARAVAEEHGVPPEEVLGGHRGTRVVWAARNELYLRLWREGRSIFMVSRMLRKDHTSIMNGLRRVLGDAAYEVEVGERERLRRRARIEGKFLKEVTAGLTDYDIDIKVET